MQQSATASAGDREAVDAAMGRTCGMQTGGVYECSMARSDLRVTSDGVQIMPALAPGCWLAFEPSGGNGAVAMGNLVLPEQEYDRVTARLQRGGVGQTAVREHLLDLSPALWWVHVEAQGDRVETAQTVHDALATTGTPPANPSGSAAAAIEIAITRAISNHDVGDDPDVLAFDPGLGRRYAAAEAGTAQSSECRDRTRSRKGASTCRAPTPSQWTPPRASLTSRWKT